MTQEPSHPEEEPTGRSDAATDSAPTDSAAPEQGQASEIPSAPPSRDDTADTDNQANAAEPDAKPAAEPTAEEPTAADTAEADDEEESAPAWVPEPDKLLFSLLFASHEYLDARGLREIMGPEWDTPRLRQLVRKLNREFETTESPFEIAETEGTFRLRTLPKYFPWTRKLFKDSAPRRLSQAALETLAIVAYKQPVTKAEVESIRGVNVDGSMKTLLDKRLIDIGRRSDSLGQAFTYHTTRDFMRYFGISRVPDDLPRLAEFEGILNAQSLIPQMDADGDVREVTRPEEEPEQLSLGMGNPDAGAGSRE